MYDDCQSAIALNEAVLDRYDNRTACYDIYVGLTCDLAFDATAQLLKEPFIHTTLSDQSVLDNAIFR